MTREEKNRASSIWQKKNRPRVNAVRRARLLELKKDPEKWRLYREKIAKYQRLYFKKRYQDPKFRKHRHETAIRWAREHLTFEKRQHHRLRYRYKISLE